MLSARRFWCACVGPPLQRLRRPVEVGTNVADDSAAAVKLLSEMAEKQSRKFEEVFADPANKALANRTYTSRHRSSVNTDYLER